VLGNTNKYRDAHLDTKKMYQVSSIPKDGLRQVGTGSRISPPGGVVQILFFEVYQYHK